MRKAILIGSTVIVLAAVIFAGNDPWKAKPYQQWDEKDVRKILADSPWSKVIEVAFFVRNRDLPETGTIGGGAPGGSRCSLQSVRKPPATTSNRTVERLRT